MNDFQKRLGNLSIQLDRKEERYQNRPQDFSQTGDWVVVKNNGELRSVVGFNLKERDAKILASSQTAEIVKDAEQELLLRSFQPMLEIEARIQKLLQY